MWILNTDTKFKHNILLKSDQDRDPHWFGSLDPALHWDKKLDSDQHWNQCGSSTLIPMRILNTDSKSNPVFYYVIGSLRDNFGDPTVFFDKIAFVKFIISTVIALNKTLMKHI